jgi:azurin
MRLVLTLFICVVAAATAQLPLELKPGARVCLIGNSLFDRMRDDGTFEALLHQRFPQHRLVVRNLAWSADEVALRPRPDGFGDLNQHLTEHKADVIFAAFGFNESFKGVEAVGEFETLLKAFLIELKSHHYNGSSPPVIVLVAPNAAEKPHDHLNKQIAAYAEAMARVAKDQGVGFADVFTPTSELFAKQTSTINGVHPNEHGYRIVAEELFRATFHETPSAANEQVRAAVREKETKFFQYYRPLNYYYIKGGRAEPYGVVNFPGELEKLSQMVVNRDERIWAIAAGKTAPEKIDDSNTKELPVITGDRPINEWLPVAEELKAFKIDPRFEVNCFVSEEDFPEFVKPIAIRWDAKGRLWVSTSITYPQIYPGDEPQDKILILEDTDHDGRADKCSVWADKLHIPLSFEFGDGGVYVSDQPHLTFLKDTDGDGKADFRQKLLTGFGTEDSHHSLHDFAWSPEGDLIFRESIFHHSQVETPYGPVRARDSSFFRYTPGTGRLLAFGSYMSTNPWGITFDDWGFHVGSHPVFASAVHALNAPYPDLHVPAGSYFPAYSGTCGHEFMTGKHWPEELRGHFMRVRYKPTNEVELHEWVQHDTHFEEKKVGIVFQSTNLSFIPVDIQQGPDGAMYIADWYNPVKGHMQYSLRDTRRDKKSGRIWRVTAKGRELEEAPKIAGASAPELLKLLESDNYRTRYRAKIELRGRSLGDVEEHLKTASGMSPDGSIRKTFFLNGVRQPDDPPPSPRKLLETLWLLESFRHQMKEPAIRQMERTTIRPRGQEWPIIPDVESELIQHLLQHQDHRYKAAATRALRWRGAVIDPASELLRRSANDPSGLVRLEAAIAASYIGTSDAIEAALDLLKHPMDSYLTYALRTTLDSHTLKPLWHNNADFLAKHPQLVKFLEDSEPKKPAQMAKRKKAEQADPFDLQPGVTAVTIKAIPERLLFDLREFKVKAGAPVKLTFDNPDVTPHNLVIVQPGAADEVGMAGNEMAKLTDGMAKGFIPQSPKILHHTKLLMQGDAETLRFKAPETAGRYPYICTFPGHWLVMKGEMVVE